MCVPGFLRVLKEAEKPLPVPSVAWNRLVMMLYGAMTGFGATDPQPVDSKASVFWVWPDHTWGKIQTDWESVAKWKFVLSIRPRNTYDTKWFQKEGLSSQHMSSVLVPWYNCSGRSQSRLESGNHGRRSSPGGFPHEQWSAMNTPRWLGSSGGSLETWSFLCQHGSPPHSLEKNNHGRK